MISKAPEGKKKDAPVLVASEAAHAALKPDNRGTQAIWNYVVRKHYNFVTNLIIC